MRYTSKRAYTWSDSIAYSVGLMASDGCLLSDGRHLDLTSIDIDQLENFSKAIGRLLPIGAKRNHSATKAYRVQFRDVAHYDPRWSKSYLYYTAFVSASKPFLEYIAKQNINLFGITGNSIRKAQNAYILRYGKRNSFTLYKEMYKKCESLYLKRRKQKLEGFITREKDVIIL